MSYSPNFFDLGGFFYKHKRKIPIFISVLMVAGLFLAFSLINRQSTFAASITWDGGGGDNNWSTGENWAGDTAPGSGDIAVFDGTSTKAATIDGGHGGSVAGIQINSGYTGTITQARSFTVGTSDFSIADGEFSGSADSITFSDDFTQTGGVFTASSGTTDFDGSITISAGTWNHNSGTVTLTSTNDETFDVNSTLALNNLTVNTGGNSDDVTLGSSDTITVAGAVTLTNGRVFGDGATIEANGTVGSPITTFDGGFAILDVNCACSITNSGGAMMGLTLDNAGASYTNSNGSSHRIFGDLTINNGTFNAGSNTTVISRDFTLGASGTFNDDSGSVNFQIYSFSPSTDGNDRFTFEVSGDITFNNLEVTSDEETVFEIEAGDTITVGGTFTNDLPGVNGILTRIETDTPGSSATIDLASSITETDIKWTDINITGGNTVTCIVRCLDGGGNDMTDMTIGDYGIHEFFDEVSSLTVSESGTTSTFDMRLDRQPSADVTITPSSSDTGEATISPSSMTFTSANYATAQTFTITGVADSTDDGAQEVTMTFSASSGDTNYDGIGIDSRTVTVMDVDTGADSIDFDTSADAQAQDVKNSGAADIIYFEYDYYGMGWLESVALTTTVDITSSDVKPGCIVDVDGTDYQIIAIIDGSDGYIRIGPIPLIDIDPGLDAISPQGTVNSITCTGSADGSSHGGLTEGVSYIQSRTVTEAGGDNYSEDGFMYDSVNDVIWSVDDWNTGELTRTVESTGAVSQISTAPTEAGRGAVDSAGYIWIPDESNDDLVVLDGSDGSYAFGTQGASTFSTVDAPKWVAYDSTQDSIWVVGDGASHVLEEFNPATGASRGTLTLTTLTYITGMVYDSTNNAIWIAGDGGGNEEVLKVNASTRAAFDTDQATSTYDTNINTDNNSPERIMYDASRDELYISQRGCNPSRANSFSWSKMSVLDASDGSYKGYIYTAECAYQGWVDEASDTLFVHGSGGGEIHKVHLPSHSYDVVYGVYESSYGLTVDDDGDVWVGSDDYDGDLHEMVENGVPTDSYYAVTSTDTSQIDVSADTSFTGVDVTDAGTVYYALSFDDRSSFVRFNSPATVFVSDRNADTGNGDGTYSYLENDGTTWTAASENNAETALAEAMAHSNNRMTGTQLEAITQTDLEGADAFQAGVTTTLDIGVMLTSTDAATSSSFTGVDFTFAAGGSSSTTETTETTTSSGETAQVVACSPTRDITVTLSGTNIKDYILSESIDFATDEWVAFENQNGDLDPTMWAPFTLSEGDGTKTLYIKFRSPSGDQSEILTADVVLDTEGECRDVGDETDEEGNEEGEDGSENDGHDGFSEGDLVFDGCLGSERVVRADERNTFMFGVATPGQNVPQGIPSTIELVQPGDYIRSISDDTVYCVTDELHRRAFVGETDYFTHTRSFEQTRWITDFAMSNIPLVGPMLPRVGNPLKFDSTPEVYVHEAYGEDDTKGLLRWIVTEELASAIFGRAWADFVLDVSTARFPRFIIGEPVLEPIEVDVESLRERDLLNEQNAEIQGEVLGSQQELQYFTRLTPSE